MDMRTFIIITVIIVILAGGSLVSNKHINYTAQDMLSKLELVESSIKDQKWEQARENLSAVEESWERTKSWWSILLQHQEIDNIDLALKKLGKYVETKGMSLSLAEVSALKLLVQHITETESLSWENIF